MVNFPNNQYDIDREIYEIEQELARREKGTPTPTPMGTPPQTIQGVRKQENLGVPPTPATPTLEGGTPPTPPKVVPPTPEMASRDIEIKMIEEELARRDQDQRQAEIKAYKEKGGGFLPSMERGFRSAAIGVEELLTPSGTPPIPSVNWKTGQLPHEPTAEDKAAMALRDQERTRSIMEQQAEIEKIPQRPELDRAMKAAKAKEGYYDKAEAIVSELAASPDKLGLFADLMAEQTPVIATTIAGSKGLGALVNPTTKLGQAGVIAGGAGAGSYAVTYGPNLTQAIKSGMSLPEARQYAARRSAIQAIVDAGTASLIPVKIGGSQIINIPAQTAIQIIGGGGGEALAALGVGETPEAEDVILEGLLEAIGLPGDIISEIVTRPQAQQTPPGDVPPPGGSIPPSPPTPPAAPNADALMQSLNVYSEGTPPPPAAPSVPQADTVETLFDVEALAPAEPTPSVGEVSSILGVETPKPTPVESLMKAERDQVNAVTPEQKAVAQQAEVEAATQVLNEQAPAVNVPSKRKKSKFKNPDVIQRIAELGGMTDPDGEVRNLLDAPNKMIPGVGKMIRDDGMHPDYIREALQEEGYPGMDTLDGLYQAIGNTRRGQRVQSVHKATETVEANEKARQKALNDQYSQYTPQELDQLIEQDYRTQASRMGIQDADTMNMADLMDHMAERQAIMDVEAEALFDSAEASIPKIYNDIPFDFGPLQAQAITQETINAPSSLQVQPEPAGIGSDEGLPAEGAPAAATESLGGYPPAAGGSEVPEAVSGIPGQAGGFLTEQTDQGEQLIIPGAERISDKALAERKMQEAMKASKPQQAMDDGLFDTGARSQTDLLDTLASSPAPTTQQPEQKPTPSKEEVSDILFPDSQPAQKLEDFGQKIGGARKDLWREGNMTSADLAEYGDRELGDLVRKERVWPTPDYSAIAATLHEGMMQTETGKASPEAAQELANGIAYLIKRIRDGIPKPADGLTREQMTQYVDALNYIREYVMNVRMPDDLSNLYDRAFTDHGPSIEADDIRSLANRYLGGRKLIQALSPSRWDMKAASQEAKRQGFPGKKEAWQNTYSVSSEPVSDYQVTPRKRSDGSDYWVVRLKAGDNTLSNVMKTEAEAQEYGKAAMGKYALNNNKRGGTTYHPTREEAIAKAKELTGAKRKRDQQVRPQLARIERKGKEVRKGDVTTQQFMDTFGFRGGEFGNWNTDKDRQQSLNHAYDALIDLADVLGIPPLAISLNGELAIAFGARGKAGAAAHYEPGRVVINLTKMNGAGALAHEWAHAVDDYFGRMGGGDALSTKADRAYASYGRTKNLRPELAAAWKKVMDVMIKREATTEMNVEQASKALEAGKKTARTWYDNRRKYIEQKAPDRLGEWDTLVSEVLDNPGAPVVGTHPSSARDLVFKPQIAIEALYKEIMGSSMEAKARKAMAQNLRWLEPKRKNLEEAVAGRLKRTVDTNFMEGAKLLDQTKSKPYWATLHEMFARAFEAYVNDKIEAQGNLSQYLVHSTQPFAFGSEGAAYPDADERVEINKAFDELVGNLKVEDGKKLYQRGQYTTAMPIRLNKDQIVSELKTIASNVFGDALKVQVFNRLTDPKGNEVFGSMTTLGRTTDGVAALASISLSNANRDPVWTLNHEGLHFLKEMGAFTDAEWGVLSSKAKSTWIAKYKIKARYEGMLSNDQMVEEAIAEAYADFHKRSNAGGVVGAVRSAFSKITEFLGRVANYFRGQGFITSRDIFSDVMAGNRRITNVEGVSVPTQAFQAPDSYPVFYSALYRELDLIKQEKGTASQWLGIIRNLTQKGVKQEEIDWSGIESWLNTIIQPSTAVEAKPNTPVTKEQILEYLRTEGAVQVKTIWGADIQDNLDWYNQVEDVDTDSDYYKELVKEELDQLVEEARQMHEDMFEEGDAPFDEADMRSELQDKAEDIAYRQASEAASYIYTAPGFLGDYVVRSDNEENFVELQLHDGSYEEYKSVRDAKERAAEHNAQAIQEADIGDIPIQNMDFPYKGWTTQGPSSRYRVALFTWANAPKDWSYNHSHFSDHENFIAHVRWTDRTTNDGKKALYIEEIQSDLHQEARDAGGFKGSPELDAAIEKAEADREAANEKLREIDARYDEMQKPLMAQYEAARAEVYAAVKDAGLEGITVAWLGEGAQRPRIGIPDYTTIAEALSDRTTSAESKKAVLTFLVIKAGSGQSYDAIKAATDKVIESTEALREVRMQEVKESAPIREQADKARRAIEDAKDAPEKAPLHGSWREMVFKRMLRYAAENGYDTVAWAHGDENIRRYKDALTEKMDKLIIEFNQSGGGDLIAVNKGEQKKVGDFKSPAELNRTVGKAMADKAYELRATQGDKVTLEGNDIRVGGEGMRFAYDEYLPKWAAKYVKKWGATVGKSTFKGAEGETYTYTGRDTTLDELRQIKAKLDKVAAEVEALFKDKSRDTEGEIVVDGDTYTVGSSPAIIQGPLPSYKNRQASTYINLNDLRTRVKDLVLSWERVPEESFSNLVNGILNGGYDRTFVSEYMRSIRELLMDADTSANGLSKWYDAKVDNKPHTTWSVDMTPAMKESVLQGQPLFMRPPAPNSFLLPERTVGEIIKDNNLTFTQKLGALKEAEPWANTFAEKRRFMQDNFIQWQRMQARMEELLGRPLSEAEDLYAASEAYSGRAGEKLQQLEVTRMNPLVESVIELGKKLGQGKDVVKTVEDYLYALHAPERNAEIAKINPKFSDEGAGLEGRQWGSGMSDTEAAEIVASAKEKGIADDLNAIAKQVRTILDESLKERVKMGLMTQETADEWKAKYKNYVPLRGLEELDGEYGGRTGTGFQVKGPESLQALGRKSKAGDILANVMTMAQEAIIRGEKNRVFQVLANLVAKNPESKLWKINKMEVKRFIDPATGLVKEQPMAYPSGFQPADDTIFGKINGKAVRITIDDRRLMSPLKRLDSEAMGAILKTLASINRYLSSVNTSYNPEFVISNGVRDILAALVTAQEFGEKGLTRAILKNYPKAIKAAWGGVQGKSDTETQRLFREYAGSGGRVSFFQTDQVASALRKIENEIATQGPGGLMATKRGMRSVLGFIDTANQSVDNAVRFATYMALREKGWTKQKAALAAKNITVNFNKKGELGPAMNALFMFYNAGIQGSFRMFKALKSKRVQAVVGGIVFMGVLQDILNVMLGGDDDDEEAFYDKIPDFEKESNLIIILPIESIPSEAAIKSGQVGKVGNRFYFKFPLPYGYRTFHNMGMNISATMRGAKTVPQALAAQTKSLLDNFNPVGGSGSFANILAPTLVDPMVDLLRNKDFADRNIVTPQNPFDATPMPASHSEAKSTSAAYKEAAQAINALTGGDEFIPGAVDIPPEAMEYIAAQITGAAGATFGRAVKFVEKLYKGEELEAFEIPFARKVVGLTSSYGDMTKAYDRMNRVESLWQQVDGHIKAGNREAAAKLYERNKDIINLYGKAPGAGKAGTPGGSVRGVKDDLKKLRKAQKEIEAGKMPEDKKKEALDKIKAARNQIIVDWNRRYLRATKLTGKDTRPF